MKGKSISKIKISVDRMEQEGISINQRRVTYYPPLTKIPCEAAELPEDATPIQTMAGLLKQGATLTEHSCPACSSPLFKLKSGDLWCAQCQKRVIVVKEGTPPTEATRPMLLGTLESTVLTKIQEIEKKIREETDPQQLERLNSLLFKLLENLERLRKIKRT